MRLGRNLAAGIANSIWSAVIGLAVVPLYLKYLGVESYGLIGFFATTQALLQLLDMGMAPTINREVARCSASGDLSEAGKLLHTLAVVYWGIAAAIALLIFSLAPWISEYWLQSKKLPPETISHAVMLMGLVIACRWPIGLYQGALNGAHRITISSSISMIMITLGNLGAVGVLAFVKPSIEAFFIWQAIVGLIYAVTMRVAAWKIIGRAQNKFDSNKLKSVWRFTAGMGGLSLTGLVFTQLDKVILSKMLGLEDFGHYMLAMTVVNGLSVLVMPIFNVMFPRYTALVAKGDTIELTSLYRLGTRLLSAVVFPGAMVLVVFGKDLIFLWTRNLDIASSVGPLVAVLVVGTALNGIMHLPYALQLAYGKTWIPLSINIGLMFVTIPLLIVLTKTYGALGGAMAWLITEVIYVIVGPLLTHRYILKGLGLKWIFQDLGIPILTSVLVGVLANYTIVGYNTSLAVNIAWAIVFGMLALLMAVVTSPRLCEIALNYLKSKKSEKLLSKV